MSLPNYTMAAIGALIGAVAGSFFNVVAERTVSERPWWGSERSCCPSCGRTLQALDLIPLISWIASRGKCRYCKNTISVRYPIVELLYSLWGAVALYIWGPSPAGVGAMAGGWLMMLNALTDLQSGYIYDHLAGAIAVAGALLRIFGGTEALLDGVIGAAAAAGIIAIIVILSRGGMGWGDATLMGGAGAILGWKMALIAAYLGFMIGGLFAVLLVLFKKAARKDSVPLAPFLTAGFMAALVWGPDILGYLGQSPGWPWR
ncbi:MAG: prepilin peptidase [Synergistota bacterium]|nr:prepilin peptidase [Synergistota bacterium]